MLLYLICPNFVLAKRWICNFGIRLILLLNEYIQASQWRVIWKSPPTLFQSSAGPEEWRVSIAQARTAGGGLTSVAPPVCLISGEENLIPPSLLFLSTLGRVCSVYHEPQSMWFHCLGWQPTLKLSASLGAACWSVGEKTGIGEELFEKSLVQSDGAVHCVFCYNRCIIHVNHFCPEAFQWCCIMCC